MTITFRAAELNSASGIFQQALLGQPSAEPLAGDIITRADVEFTSDDGRIQSGVWESEPGKSRWEFLTRGEIITIVSGAMTVEEDDGDPVHLIAGTSAIFPIGWKVRGRSPRPCARCSSYTTNDQENPQHPTFTARRTDGSPDAAHLP
ncbi:hypothetical protein N806_29090 [Rhodococcus sp. P27]|nr:hypothetical protein N806_29090 [Rhodococcus sp. P27]